MRSEPNPVASSGTHREEGLQGRVEKPAQESPQKLNHRDRRPKGNQGERNHGRE